MRSAAVLGAGVFGVTAALALRRRGWRVDVFDPGDVPHPLAESTDVSKAVRADYGSDEAYAEMAERAIDGWRRWQSAWSERLYHETGVLFVTREEMKPGGFEHDSFEVLTRRGHALQRLDASAIARRFPAWSTGAYVDGYYNAMGGWAASGRVVERLVREARDAGVSIHERVRATRLDERGGRVVGFSCEGGERATADVVVVAAGAWTGDLVPWIAGSLRTVGQPVFHLATDDARLFDAPGFVVFGADIARTGWYGFPRSGGVVKVANHGVGRVMHPESLAERAVTREEEEAMRAFVAGTLPELAGARCVFTRVCVYCDTFDENFWIAPDPERAGLVVAAGGSGHAFKFAPLVGEWIADAVHGGVVPRFRWRAGMGAARGEEAARNRS